MDAEPAQKAPWAFEALEARVLLSGAELAGSRLFTSEGWGFYPASSKSDELSPAKACQTACPEAQVAEIDWKGRSVQVRKDEWIVQFARSAMNDLAWAGELAAMLSALPGIEVLCGLGLAGQVLVRAPGLDAAAIEGWLGGNANVAYYEPNALLSVQQVPNDSGFSNLWAMHNTGQSGGTADADINAVEAWDQTTGSSDVVVAVIDTGIDYNHPDLAGNIWLNAWEIAGDGLDNDGNGYADDVHGWDWANFDSNPTDDHGHGTHVAGTIGAVGNNGIGVAGVNWQVQMMALKFLDSFGLGTLADAISAINYATMMKRVRGVNIVAINASWGGGGYYAAMRDAIAAAGSEGILFVAAAGNGGDDGIGDDNDAEPSYPASYNLDCIISVAATDRQDSLAGFSNYGALSVDLAAPGVSIYSTIPGGGYEWYNGTSMATPHVTGVVGLLAANSPAATAEEIKSAILAGVDGVAALAGMCLTGGRLNANQALNQLGVVGPRVLSIAPAGAGPPTSTITIRFTDDIVPASVSPENFLLRDNGPDDLFDTADDFVFTLEAANLSQPQPNKVIIELASPLGEESYRLTIRGTGPNPVRSELGLPLNDGADKIHFFDVVPASGPYEPNDCLADAIELDLQGGVASLSAHVGDGFHGTRDVDLFAFQAPAGATITLDVDAYVLGTGLDPVLRLFNQAGAQLAVNDDTDGLDSYIAYTCTAGGTFYVGVSGYGNSQYDPAVAGSGIGGSVGDYLLTVALDTSRCPGEIRGTVWYDRNGDAVRDQGEEGLAGWTVFADLNDNGLLEAQVVHVLQSPDVPMPILDFSIGISELWVTGLAGTILDVDVTLDIYHTYDGDLEVYLFSPDGAGVELFSRVGGSGVGFSNTTLDDEADQPISSGRAPFTGRYKPSGLLSDFDRKDPNGTWSLVVFDLVLLDTGMLNSWSLSITAGEPSAQGDAEGRYSLTGLSPGSYKVMEVPAGGWRQTAPAEGFTRVTLGGGQVVEGLDFGNIREVPGVLEGVINGAAWQRSCIRSLSFTFDQDASVGLDVGDLTLFDESAQRAVDLSAATLSYDAASFTATWDLSAVELPNAHYAATLSSDGLAGGAGPTGQQDFTVRFHRLSGDANGDCEVDVGDLGVLGANFNASYPNVPGDLNGDDVVDVGDLAILGCNYGKVLPPPPPAGGTSTFGGGTDELAAVQAAQAARSSTATVKGLPVLHPGPSVGQACPTYRLPALLPATSPAEGPGARQAMGFTVIGPEAASLEAEKSPESLAAWHARLAPGSTVPVL